MEMPNQPNVKGISTNYSKGLPRNQLIPIISPSNSCNRSFINSHQYSCNIV